MKSREKGIIGILKKQGEDHIEAYIPWSLCRKN
jgi:hypothetical protein